jgi:hypothetical protein
MCEAWGSFPCIAKLLKREEWGIKQMGAQRYKKE